MAKFIELTDSAYGKVLINVDNIVKIFKASEGNAVILHVGILEEKKSLQSWVKEPYDEVKKVLDGLVIHQ